MKPRIFYLILASSLLAAVLVLCFCTAVSHTVALMGFAGAALFTISFWFQPDHFRSRSGSLRPAFCLAAFGWFCAAVVIVLSVFGRIE
jgi:hypothetical protein